MASSNASNGTVWKKFFRLTLRSRLCERVEALQADLDAYLYDDNHERPHLDSQPRPSPVGDLERFISGSSAR
jgi:hypothetical protein